MSTYTNYVKEAEMFTAAPAAPDVESPCLSVVEAASETFATLANIYESEMDLFDTFIEEQFCAIAESRLLTEDKDEEEYEPDDPEVHYPGKAEEKLMQRVIKALKAVAAKIVEVAKAIGRFVKDVVTKRIPDLITKIRKTMADKFNKKATVELTEDEVKALNYDYEKFLDYVKDNPLYTICGKIKAGIDEYKEISNDDIGDVFAKVKDEIDKNSLANAEGEAKEFTSEEIVEKCEKIVGSVRAKSGIVEKKLRDISKNVDEIAAKLTSMAKKDGKKVGKKQRKEITKYSNMLATVSMSFAGFVNKETTKYLATITRILSKATAAGLSSSSKEAKVNEAVAALESDFDLFGEVLL